MLKIHEKIVDEFAKLGKGTKVIVFGSIARGNYRLDSDIDIAIITNNKKVREKSSRIADSILTKYGKVVSVKYFTNKEFLEKQRQRNPFVMEITKGKVMYGGG